jgi:UDP-3-O-[3-hydroxymyristoyl] glucosamine N-acyltransferase
MRLTARAVADLAGGTLRGDSSVEVTGIATPGTATSSSVVFVDDPKRFDEALASAAGIIIAGRFAEPDSGRQASGAAPKPDSDAPAMAGRPSNLPGAALVVCDNPRLAFARVGRRLTAPPPPTPGIDQAAAVDPSVTLGVGVSVGPRAVVDAGAFIGDRVALGPGTHIGRGVRIGADCVLRSNVTVYPGTEIGARVVVHAGTVLGSDGFGYVRDEATGAYEAFPQVGRLVIEDDVELGALCTVDRGALGETRIAAGAKLDNQVHVAHNVRIGRNVVIAAQTGIAGSSVIEDNVVIAGQVGIADHVTIESGAILGAQCGVPTGKVIRGPGVLFWGTPARPIRQYLKELAALARLVKKQAAGSKQ